MNLQGDIKLKALRSDLIIADGGFDAGGEQGYVVHDPIRHKYFRIPRAVIAELAAWDLNDISGIGLRTGRSAAEITASAKFLSNARLLAEPIEGVPALIEDARRARRSLMHQLVHNYLFFRVPLFNPTAMLDKLLPLARVFASRGFLTVLAVLALLGAYMAARQWDQVAWMFARHFSLEGAALLGVTVVVLKIFHELGHGLIARAYGCRVPSVGVAFMVMAPMLYTEVSDAWRLKDARQRLHIAAGGILVELGIAIVALFLWAFLPDGSSRTVAFFVASAAWMTSLLVNLSPFMRFDGYHMLGDALRMHSLGPRAFALARWQMRELLFGLGDAVPERFAPSLHCTLIAYAYGTMFYRLGLFLGIAALVYHMLPKAVGLPLATIEVVFFILLPVWREIAGWKAFGIRNLLSTRRSQMNAACLAVLMLLAALPLDRHVSMPAVLVPAVETEIHAPEPALIESVHVARGAQVKRGQVLFRIASAEISNLRQRALIRLEIVQSRLSRIVADEPDRAMATVLEQERKSILDEIAGLDARLRRLDVTSPIDGTVTEVMRGAAAGVWVSPRLMLAHVSGRGGLSAIALAHESDTVRLLEGTEGQFVAEDGSRPAIAMKLMELGLPGGEGAAFTYLSAEHGGPVAMGGGEHGDMKPLLALLPVKFFASGEVPELALRGRIVAEAEPQSLLYLAASRLVSVFIRESGF